MLSSWILSAPSPCLYALSCDFGVQLDPNPFSDRSMESMLSGSMAPKFQAMSVETSPSAISKSQQRGHGNGVHSDPESGASAAEASSWACLPDILVDTLLPEVPPGNLEQTLCGIPKRFSALIQYFGFLIYSMVSGWVAFAQYRAIVSKRGYFGPPFGYIWLASLVLLLVYNVIGPLPRALGDLLCVLPGGYYRYKLQQNDCLHPGFRRNFKLILTTLSSFIQLGVFYLSFFSKVIEQGVKVPAAIVAIVPVVFNLGFMIGTNSLQENNSQQPRSLLREALYSDSDERSINRRTARQKLAGRILITMLLIWVTFGVFMTIVYVTASKFGVGWRSTSADINGACWQLTDGAQCDGSAPPPPDY